MVILQQAKRFAALLAVGGMYSVLRTDNNGPHSGRDRTDSWRERILSALTRICDYGLLQLRWLKPWP